MGKLYIEVLDRELETLKLLRKCREVMDNGISIEDRMILQKHDTHLLSYYLPYLPRN